MDLNKKIIITGASGGLGEILTGRLAQQGATIAAIARSSDKLKNLQTESKSQPGIIEIFPADVTTPAQVKTIFISILEKFKQIDALVHLTGGFAGGKFIAETDDVMWREMLDVNLNSAFYCCREAMTIMSEQKCGKIITISAAAALHPKAKRAAYTVAKAGVIALTRTLAEEGKMVNVQANCIAPGIILTAANQIAMPDADTAQWVRPEQIAATIAFLCSAQADAITGTVIEMP